MLGLHQVLSNQGQFPIGCWPPAEPDIGCRVRVHHLRRKNRNVANGRVEFQFLGKSEQRLKHKLVVRARTVVGNRIEVVRKARFVAYLQVQVGIRTLQIPPVEGFPIRRDFHAVGRTP